MSKKPGLVGQLGSLVLIAAIVGGAGAAFLYTAGALSPHKLTPDKIVAAFAPPGGAVLGHRRNHAKGICFTGTFEASGNGTADSRAKMLAKGSYPVVGRFNIGTPMPTAADASARVRGLGLQISAGDQVWRMAMINAPVFAVSTPHAFYELLKAQGSKDADAMKTFAGKHPEIAAFGAWAKTAPWTDSYADTAFNGLNTFLFVDGSGATHPVRWSFKPTATPVDVKPDDLAKQGPDVLEKEITERVGKGPQTWTMVATLAEPDDPTKDPSKVWPTDRRTVELGTLTASKIEPEADGPCRDINFDPTVLPDGVTVSDDPFPAARSAVYAKSYDLRSAEEKDYPRTAGATP